MAHFLVCALCLQMGSVDKDFRFMAVSDLLALLKSGKFSLEEDMEHRVRRCIACCLVSRPGICSRFQVCGVQALNALSP